jgi:hypothetical protein
VAVSARRGLVAVDARLDRLPVDRLAVDPVARLAVAAVDARLAFVELCARLAFVDAGARLAVVAPDALLAFVVPARAVDVAPVRRGGAAAARAAERSDDGRERDDGLAVRGRSRRAPAGERPDRPGAVTGCSRGTA